MNLSHDKQVALGKKVSESADQAALVKFIAGQHIAGKRWAVISDCDSGAIKRLNKAGIIRAILIDGEVRAQITGIYKDLD